MELFGRREQLAEVAARIRAGRRLVTVVGPGGVGKTTLASAVVDELAPAFPLGAHRVDLSLVDRPDAVGGRSRRNSASRRSRRSPSRPRTRRRSSSSTTASTSSRRRRTRSERSWSAVPRRSSSPRAVPRSTGRASRSSP